MRDPQWMSSPGTHYLRQVVTTFERSSDEHADVVERIRKGTRIDSVIQEIARRLARGD